MSILVHLFQENNTEEENCSGLPKAAVALLLKDFFFFFGSRGA
jgi:hypothetical protein